MAKDKKIFQIQINGITESIDAVKSLNEQLREAEGIIKNLNNAKIAVLPPAGLGARDHRWERAVCLAV